MADVTINYKGSKIAELSASGTKTLKTSGTYCEGDISVNYAKTPIGEILGDNGFFELEVIDVTVGANTASNGSNAYSYLAGLVGSDKIVACALLNNANTNNQLIMLPGSIYGTQASYKDYRAAYRFRTGGAFQGCAIYTDYSIVLVSGTKYRLWVAKTYNITNPTPY